MKYPQRLMCWKINPQLVVIFGAVLEGSGNFRKWNLARRK
jgi:hypothetical protein